MKRQFVTASIDPFAKEMGYSDDEVMYIHALAGYLMEGAKHNLPEVTIEITSYRVNRTDNKLILTGDMTYNGQNEWLTIECPFIKSRKDVDYKSVVMEYLRQVVNTYGLEVFENTELFDLASRL